MRLGRAGIILRGKTAGGGTALEVKNMKLVCLGDSLTYGYGVPRKDCWVSLAAASMP